jgi:hypothetical protein
MDYLVLDKKPYLRLLGWRGNWGGGFGDTGFGSRWGGYIGNTWLGGSRGGPGIEDVDQWQGIAGQIIAKNALLIDD